MSPSKLLLAYFVSISLLLTARVSQALGIDCKEHCEAWSCPCSCYPTYKEVRCSGKNITDLGRFPSTTRFESFDFTQNRLEKIDKNEFNFIEFSELFKLHLGNNRIHTLNKKSFNGLKKLKTLFLGNNQIEVLPNHVFEGLESLKKLYLNNNQIREIRTKDCFGPVKKTLELLYLQNNKIRFITKQTFHNFVKLKIVDLSRNQLQHIDSTGLVRLPSLEHIYLRDNPLLCGEQELCQLHPLLRRGWQMNGTVSFDDIMCHNENKKPIDIFELVEIVLSENKCRKPEDQTGQVDIVPSIPKDEKQLGDDSGASTLNQNTFHLVHLSLTIALFLLFSC